jgi:thiol-disulfide isomerase/thioredoxin
MNKIKLIIPFLLLFTISACGGDSQNGSQADATPESIVENAVFTDLDGNEVSIQDFKGKFVMIDFWESWCGPCLQVFPSLDQLREEYPDNFEVFAVTVGLNEGPEEARAFSEKHGYDFNWLYDENGVFNRLGGQGIPFKAYVDPDGKFIKIEMGSHGREGDYNRTKAMIQEYF